MFPVIVCIAKHESDYIEEFVKYHLKLGFKYIYLYDNEDEPTYETLLDKYKNNIKFIHMPFNNYEIGVQYKMLQHFIDNFLFKNEQITHVTHIDIDEFIVLKKHKNICDFILQYIVDDCQGIAMNWRFFGSSGKTEKTDEPVTLRFTMCENMGNIHIKTLFRKEYFVKFCSCHDIALSAGHIKTTMGIIVQGPFNHVIDFCVIQLNHYKSKTLPEFRYIRSRGAADIVGGNLNEDVEGNFNAYDINEIEDLTAYNFYKKIIDDELVIQNN